MAMDYKHYGDLEDGVNFFRGVLGAVVFLLAGYLIVFMAFL